MSPHVLKSSLNQVQNIFTEKFPQFQVSNKDLLFYYSFGDFLYTRRHLYLTVKIPIYSFHLPISVYKVYSYPVPVNSSSNHATQLMNTPPYFLNTKDHQHYALITSQQLSQCKGTTTLFCSFNIALKASASPSCLSAVFFNHKEAVSKMCDFRFLTNILPTAMYELSPSHLLLYRTTMIALDCANGQRILKGCSFCVVKIPCLCSVTSNNLYLPPRLGKCNNRTDKVTILHPVNLALLQQFFDKDAHSTVFGDTIFEDFVHITLPNFQIFNHSFSQYLANDKQQHLSLTRIAKAVRRDGKVLKNLAESMIAGQVEFAVDKWPDTSGILAITATSLAFLGFIFSIWSCYKIRTVLLPVLLLHQAHSTTASTLKSTLSFIYHQAQENTPPPSINEHIYASFTTPWSYVSISILTTIFVMACIAYLWRTFQRSHRTSLHLELTTGPTCELFTLLTLPLCPHNWKIQTPEDIFVCTYYHLIFYSPLPTPSMH